MPKLTPEERAKRKLKREEQKKAKQEKVGRLNERKLKRLLIIVTFLNENPQRWVKTLKKNWSFRTRDVTEWIELDFPIKKRFFDFIIKQTRFEIDLENKVGFLNLLNSIGTSTDETKNGLFLISSSISERLSKLSKSEEKIDNNPNTQRLFTLLKTEYQKIDDRDTICDFDKEEWVTPTYEWKKNDNQIGYFDIIDHKNRKKTIEINASDIDYIKSDGKTWTGKLRNKKRFPKIVQANKKSFLDFQRYDPNQQLKCFNDPENEFKFDRFLDELFNHEVTEERYHIFKPKNIVDSGNLDDKKRAMKNMEPNSIKIRLANQNREIVNAEIIDDNIDYLELSNKIWEGKLKSGKDFPSIYSKLAKYYYEDDNALYTADWCFADNESKTVFNNFLKKSFIKIKGDNQDQVLYVPIVNFEKKQPNEKNIKFE